MTDLFLFGVFPYVAVAIFVVGIGWRFRTARATVGTRSSQTLEDRLLFWASVPWHYAILLILAAHLGAVLLPGVWAALLGEPTRLAALEVTGIALGLWAVASCALMLYRRATNARLRAVTTPIDWMVIALLLVQVGTGVAIAMTLRWGSVWYLHTAVPWLHSLAALSPEVEHAAMLPAVVKVHAVSAFLLLAVVPFSRLVHAITVPVHYLWRPYQRTIWNRDRGNVRPV
jgi:nitrate reductase gamma subunit